MLYPFQMVTLYFSFRWRCVASRSFRGSTKVEGITCEWECSIFSL